MFGMQHPATDTPDTRRDRFDVFVSYDRDDAATVSSIVDGLHRSGISAWMDVEQIRGGDRWIASIGDAMRQAGAAIVFLRRAPTRWMEQEIELALRRAGDDDAFRVIPVLLPEANDPSDLPDLLMIRNWVDLREDPTSPDHVGALVDAVQGLPSRPDVDTRNPYVGLRAFDPRDSELFFGRHDEIDEAVRRLESGPMTTIVGPSGTGKSSLIHAGLVPRLRSRRRGAREVDIVTIRVGLRPVIELAAALVDRSGHAADRGARSGVEGAATSETEPTPTGVLDAVDELDRLARRLRDDPSTLASALRARRSADSDACEIWVIDQLEQLFADSVDAADRQAFLDNVTVATQADQLTVIAGLRSDAYGFLDAHPRFARLVSSNVLRLDPMTESQLRAAIVEPARSVGLGLQAGLTELVLRDLRSASAPLPLLQHAMFTLYEAGAGHRLTVRAYEELGGVNGALARHAEQVYADLPTDDRDVARHLLANRLAAPLGSDRYTRLLVPVSTLTSRHAGEVAVARVVDHLTDGRILSRATAGDGSPAVEVVHDTLFTAWPRLERWLAESASERRALRSIAAAAGEWRLQGEAPSYLFSGRRLDDALRVDARSLNDVERRFLEASGADDEAHQFAAARARAVRLGLGTMVGFASMIVLFATVADLKLAFVVTSVVISAPVYLAVGGAIGLSAWYGRRDSRLRLLATTLTGAIAGGIVSWGTIGTAFRAGDFQTADLVFGALLGASIGALLFVPASTAVRVVALVAATTLIAAIDPGSVWNADVLDWAVRAAGGALVGCGAGAGLVLSPREGAR